jgi:DNA-binding NarL/FixJ family response regulator
MSVAAHGRPEPLGIPARILVAGSDLLAGALASALEACGFATRHIVPREPEIERGIEWRPNLVIVDVRSLDVTSGSVLIGKLRRVSLKVCVIDAADDGERFNAWMEAGSSALVIGSEPFDQLFRTINRILRISSQGQTATSPTSLALPRAGDRTQDPRLQLFAILTEREQVVLAELMEGHCAEEIANAGFVSISTVRSQIKAIFQKLGVNSQLAAVALARRAGWSLDSPPRNSPKPPRNSPKAPRNSSKPSSSQRTHVY